MKRATVAFVFLLLVAGGLLAVHEVAAMSGRSAPDNSPPYIKFRIPDFTVFEESVNNSMKDIDLFNVFGDPDLPPAGNDSLNFSLDASQFPATIAENKLTFGSAPIFPGNENHIVTVTVTATDLGGLTASQVVNITVIYLNRAPYDIWTVIEIFENEVSYFDLHDKFIDPDGDPLNFTYLGGASDNLSVELAPNGSAVLRPADGYFTAREILRFKATDPLGANRTGELVVRILAVYHPIPQPGQIPEPEKEMSVDEGENITFSVYWLDWIGQSSNSPNLTYDWSIDYFSKDSSGSDNFTWKTGSMDTGYHQVTCRISDGRSYVVAFWNLTVLVVNHPPVILDIWPLNNTEVVYGAKITFRANATDPDGDTLTFYWRLMDGTLLKVDVGRNYSMFSKVLSGGKQHVVILEVQDGQGGVAREFIYIRVAARPEPPSDNICNYMYLLATPLMLTAATASFRRRLCR